MASLNDLSQRFGVKPLGDRALIDLWDQCDARHPLDRALIILEAACALPWDKLTDLPLGLRDALLLTVRGMTFGNSMALSGRCPRCAKVSEFTQDLDEILACEPGETRCASLALGAEFGGITVRAPNSRDLAALYDGLRTSLTPATPAGALLEPAHHILLARCLDPMPDLVPDANLLAAISEAVDQLDPMAILAFPLDCPYCHHTWSPVLDVPALLWAEIVNGAKRILHDVRDLAKAFGWPERDILGMSRSRRQYYLGQVAS